MRPERALVHSLWIAATLLLVINDHVLKPYAPEPRWLIGKASDLSGLIVLPPVVAALLRVRSERALRVVWFAVGAAFTALKTLPLAAAAYEKLFAFLGARSVVDPTDLIALCALPVGWVVLRPTMTEPVPPGRGERIALIVGAVACIATPKSYVKGTCPAGAVKGQSFSGDVCHEAFKYRLAIGNVGLTTITVDVRRAGPTTCEGLPPLAHGSPVCIDVDLFAAPSTLTLSRQENARLDTTDSPCAVALIRLDTARPWMIVSSPGYHRLAPYVGWVPYVRWDPYSDPRETPPSLLAIAGSDHILSSDGITIAPVACQEGQ